PGPRWLRLHQGLRGGTLLPGREDHPDLRGHLADPEARDRARRAGRHRMSERERWRRGTYEAFTRGAPERPGPFESLSGLPVAPLYSPDDPRGSSHDEKLGSAG